MNSAILDYMKVIFSWPAVIGIISLIAIFRFSSEFKALIECFTSKVSKVQIGSILNFELIDLKDSGNFLLDDTVLSDLKIKENVFKARDEEIIKKSLRDAGLNEQQMIAVLIDNLSSFVSFTKITQIDKSLFAEQKELLVNLNKRKGMVDISFFTPHFEKWRQEVSAGGYDSFTKFNPNWSNWDLPMFLRFLLQNELIYEKLAQYSITAYGKEYLAFRTKIGN